MQTDAQRPVSGWRRAFIALENIEYRWLLASNAAFYLALHGQMLTRSFLAWDMTKNEMSLAYINMAYALPMIIFAMIGGVLTDRVERRGLIQFGQFILMASELTVLVLLAIGKLEFWHLIIVGIAGGMIIPVITPARIAVVYNTVGPHRLGNAMALSMGVVNMTRVIGPVVMGLAVSQYTATGAYAIASLLFVLAFLLILFGVKKKPLEDSTQGQARPKMLEDIFTGLRYVKQTRPLLICLLFGFIPMCLAMPIQNLLILFADNVWQVGEQGLGILMAVSGLGGVLGSLWVASRGENANRVKLMVANAAGFAIFLLLFSLSSSFYLALVPLLIANLCASASQTLNNTTLQLLADDSQRGRVSSFMMLAFGFTPLGVLPLAWAAQYVGVAWTTSVASVVLIVIISYFFAASATLKSMDAAVITSLQRQKSVLPPVDQFKPLSARD